MPYTTTGRFAIVIFEHSAKIVLTVYLCRASLLTLARAEHRKVTVLRRYDARMWCVPPGKNQSMPMSTVPFNIFTTRQTGVRWGPATTNLAKSRTRSNASRGQYRQRLLADSLPVSARACALLIVPVHRQRLSPSVAGSLVR